VIFYRSFSWPRSALASSAWINSLERLKKSGVEIYTSSFSKVRAPIDGENRFSERKNLSNKGDPGFVSTGASSTAKKMRKWTP
jgi:hypothetical protein